MTTLAITAAYLLFAFFMWTQVYRWLYREHMREFASLGWREKDRAFAILWGGTVSIFWPLFAPLFGIAALARAIASNHWGLFDRLERD